MSDASTRAAVIAALGLTVTSQFVPFSQSRHKANKNRSLNWRVSLHRQGRESAIVTTDYSAGIAHCPSYRQHDRSVNQAEAIRYETEHGHTTKQGSIGTLRGAEILPNSEDVIYGLLSDADVIDSGTFEQWAGDLGYDPDSRKAEAIYRTCLDIALRLRASIGDEGIAKLREAFRNY